MKGRRPRRSLLLPMAPFKKIHQADLHVITTGSGHNIIEIKNSLKNCCLSNDMSRISKMFTDGRYLNIPAPILDPDRIGLAPTGELRDPHNLYIETFKENLKHHTSEEISHTKSKEKLLSLPLSCTSKELEDKIKTLFATQVSDRVERVVRIIVGRTLVAASISSRVLPARLMRTTLSARSETWVANRVLILSSSSLEVQESRRLRSFSLDLV